MSTNKLSEIIREAENQPFKYDLFAFLRMIESASPNLPPLGTSFTEKGEIVRVEQNASLSFPASDLSLVSYTEAGKVRVEAHVLGLLGVNGPLPYFYTEHIQQQKQEFQDDSFLNFLNIFNNRLNLLFYRAWASADPCVSLGRKDDYYSRFLLSLVHSRASPQYDGEAYCSELIGNSRWFVRQVRNAEGLESILSDYFGLPVQIKEFVSDWIKLEESDQTQIGFINTSLGVSAFLGESALSLQNKFKIIIGPMTLAEYELFFPKSTKSKMLSKWVAEYTGQELDWDVCLVLAKQYVPNACLSGNSQLGRTCWLEKKPAKDRRDLVINYSSWSA